MSELEQIKRDEGFRAKPYQDHLGNWTIGYGFTSLTEYEGDVVLHLKLEEIRDNLIDLDIRQHPSEVWDILTNMAYQLGFHGLKKFKKMLRAVREYRYSDAADQMLKSKWARQTPARAKRLADRMRAL